MSSGSCTTSKPARHGCGSMRAHAEHTSTETQHEPLELQRMAHQMDRGGRCTQARVKGVHTGLAALVDDGVDILHVEKQVLRRVAHKVAPLVGHHDLGVADLDHCSARRAVSMCAAGTACGSHTRQATVAGARLRASTGRSRPGACRPRWRQTPPAAAPPRERCDLLHATACTPERVRTSTAGGGRAELMKIFRGRSCCSCRHALQALCTRMQRIMQSTRPHGTRNAPYIVPGTPACIQTGVQRTSPHSPAERLQLQGHKSALIRAGQHGARAPQARTPRVPRTQRQNAILRRALRGGGALGNVRRQAERQFTRAARHARALRGLPVAQAERHAPRTCRWRRHTWRP